MSPRHLVIAATAAVLLLGGCAPRTKYEWGSYDDSLYQYYKEPARADAFAESLQKAIARAESSDRRVPPGMYAEYGYMMQMSGRNQDAIAYFQKERDTWPESKTFMDAMIKSASAPARRKDATASPDLAPQASVQGK